MKKPRGKGARHDQASGDGGLDDDIWKHTAATLEPLKRGKPRVHPSMSLTETEKKAPRTAAPPDKPRNKPSGTEAVPAKPPPPRPSPAAPPLADFDRNSARRIRAGRVAIEARVDLHGMRQDEAHAALRAFLYRCHDRGQRYVLVITGKGRSGSDAERSVFDGTGERGVLKRNVPRWLDEPDLRRIVVSFATAAINHGGEGAIYVHLRKKDHPR